jgi:DNA polymerase-3 subunit gamma/tau
VSLYQSYRPKNFSDVVGQDFVRKILANSCKTQTFHHGYIFFGFHGIGKTTLARIFAEAVNCTNITHEGNPCHTCQNCLSYDTNRMIDVIEIDAASYTGVDNIREVIDHAKFTPTQGKYKVYIIDEVHMLSKGAFNALLKTLEEPPEHAIFLLATTEIHKVPDTILSRVIRFDLTKIGEKDMYDLLVKICAQEHISFEENALRMIVHRARGSIRDSLTMLEKCIIEKSVTEKNVE